MSMNSAPMSLPLRRSVLCLPASNNRAIAKLASLDMDTVILDLEDAVAEEQKQQGRQNIRAFFSNRPVKGREVVVRINETSSPHHQADLALLLDCVPDAVLLPKVQTADDILDLSGFLAENDVADTVRIWAMMETPLAILNAGSIAETGRTRGGRLEALVVGLNDLRKDTGVQFDPARTYLVPWLMQVLLAGRAFGLSVIDSVCNDFQDLGAYEAECAQGRSMGYDGKMLIHPAQVEAANRRFQPSAVEIAEAEAIIHAFADPAAVGINALAVNGRMVERLHLLQAQALAIRMDQIKRREKSA
jgi:citrate lyase subunit beta/citryl-CoA lyase